MDSSKIIDIIPDLFMYFIPGYIALRIKKRYRQEASYKEKEVAILSIVYSYLIDRTIFIIEAFLNKIVKLLYSYRLIVQYEVMIFKEWRTIIALIFSVLMGYAITVFPDTNIAKKIRKLLKSNTEPYSIVWNYAMKSSKGAWARVFLKDEDIYYVGMLSRYTCDPDHEIREIYLTNFSSYTLTTNEEKENNNDNRKACVLINATEIRRIEIFKD